MFLANIINPRPWSKSLCPPLVAHAEALLLEMHIKAVPNTFTNRLSPIPPWKDINEMFMTEFLPQLSMEHMTNAQANTRFTDLMHSNFSN